MTYFALIVAALMLLLAGPALYLAIVLFLSRNDDELPPHAM